MISLQSKGLSRVFCRCCCCCCCVASVVSNSVRPHGWQPTRVPRPRDSPGKNTGVGCHFLRQCMKVKSESEVTQLCPTLCDHLGQQPTRLLRPWDFPGKSTGVGSPIPQFKSINSSVISFLCGPTVTSIRDYWKNHSFDYTDLCQQSNVSAFFP